MKFIKNNSFIVLSMALSVVFTILIGLSSTNNDSNIEITVQSGDTLWTLAEKYKGNLPNEEWISVVMDSNNLNNPVILSGETLVIPEPIHLYDEQNDLVLAGDE